MITLKRHAGFLVVQFYDVNPPRVLRIFYDQTSSPIKLSSMSSFPKFSLVKTDADNGSATTVIIMMKVKICVKLDQSVPKLKFIALQYNQTSRL